MNQLTQYLVDGILNEGEDSLGGVALFGGGFKPPTNGHLEVVLQGLKENPEVKQVQILVGSGERNGVTQEESIKIWEIYKRFIPVSTQIIKVQSPFSYIKTYLQDHQDENVYIFIGARSGNEADDKDVAKRSAYAKKYSDKAIPVEIITTGGVSGTKARQAALSGNNEEFITFFPEQLTDSEREEIIQMILSVIKEVKLPINENASYSKEIDVKEKIDQLTQHMLDKGYNIEPLPTVEFVNGDSDNARDFFGKTAYYNPNNNTIVLYTEGRHPKDIVRSFAHEMIHHIQNLENRLGDVSTTNTMEDDNIDKLEQEANLKGTMTFRNWTDSLNEISLPKATQQISKLNPEVDAEEVAKDFIRLSPNLGKKDLFQYSTYDELKKELDKASQSKSQRRNQAKSMDLEDNKFIFYKDDNFTIYKLDNPSQHPESCEIAQGAKICVASNSKKYWNKYMIDGDGVLFYIRNKEYDIPHPQSVIAFMFPRKGLKIGYTEMVDYNDEDFIEHGNYQEQKEYLSSIGIPTNVIEKMFKFIPDVKPLSYYIKNHKGKKNKLKVDGKTYFFYTPDAPPSIGDPFVIEDENGKVIGVIKSKGNINKLSPLQKKWLKFRFPDLPNSIIYEITNVNKYWEENHKEINLYNIENNKLVKVGKAHLPYGPEQINTLMSGNTLEIPERFKNSDSLNENLNKIKYTTPNFELEWEEAVRYPEFKEMGKENWIKIAKQGKLVNYSSIKDILGNVDLNFDSLEEPKKQRFQSAFKKGTIETPIAVKFSDNDYDLVAGNTRLSGLVKNGEDPKIWIVNIGSINEYDNSGPTTPKVYIVKDDGTYKEAPIKLLSKISNLTYDMGGGETNYYPAKNIVIVDNIPVEEFAKEPGDIKGEKVYVEYNLNNPTSLPKANKIIASQLVYHLDNREAFAQTVANSLKDGGTFEFQSDLMNKKDKMFLQHLSDEYGFGLPTKLNQYKQESLPLKKGEFVEPIISYIYKITDKDGKTATLSTTKKGKWWEYEKIDGDLDFKTGKFSTPPISPDPDFRSKENTLRTFGKYLSFFGDSNTIVDFEELNEANKPYKHKHGFDDKLGKDPFGLNQFAREIAEEVISEGRYDTLANKLSSIAFEAFKDIHDRGEKEGSFKFRVDNPDDEHDIPSEEFYFDFEGVVEITDDEYGVDGGANAGFDNEGEEIPPLLSVKFKIPQNPTKNPSWEDISFDIKDVVRHELEHLTQDGDNEKTGKYMKDDQLIRDLIDADLLSKSQYFKLEKEVDAMLQGLYFKAKKSKRPFGDVIDDYLNIFLDQETISPQEKEDILNTWRSRRKALSLPVFEQENMEDKYKIYLDMDGVIVDFDKRFTDLAGMGPREYENSFGKDKFWDFIDSKEKGGGVGFWVGMPWMPGGPELYNRVAQHNHALLSSPSRSESSKLGKRLWKKKYTPNTDLILSLAANKKNYADGNSILIDDRESNIQQWREAGGIGILYKSADQVNKELDKLGL